MRRHLALVPVALLLFACGAPSDNGDPQRDWMHVLNRKKAASAPTASTREKQVYADSLGAFVQKHPSHGRARAVYQRIQLDFAHELAAVGRYQDAIRFYRAVLTNDATNDEARDGLMIAVDRLAVSHEKLLALEKGMSEKAVSQLLGKPMPGWKVTTDRGDVVIDSWYYRTKEGGIAGVHFRDGVLFAADANANAKLSPLVR